MSNYKDFYIDYPIRCGELWRGLRDKAIKSRLDVTFMLMVASAGLAASWEHLKRGGKRVNDAEDHPSLAHQKENIVQSDAYKHFIRRLGRVLNSTDMADNPLLAGIDVDDWLSHRVKGIEDVRPFVDQRVSFGQDIQLRNTREIIKVLRNALAHNNILTSGQGGSSIREIIFFSEHRKDGETLGYDIIGMPHTDFSAFLDSWFKLLKEFDPRGRIAQAAIAAAFEMEVDDAA